MNAENKLLLSELLQKVNEDNDMIKGKFISPEELVFEERIKMNCFYCGKYQNNWKCPPKIPIVDYSNMVNEFESGAFIYLKIPFTENNFNDVRRESSLILHKAMLQMEKYLYQYNNTTALSFIGGSCKLCKGGCGKAMCNNPYESRVPVEAIGINVIKSAKKCGISISFPPENKLTRIGLLLY